MNIKKTFRIIVSTIIILMILAIIKYYDLIKSSFYTQLYEMGFKIENIYINQLSIFTVEEIVDKLTFAHGDHILAVDLQENKHILEESFWVKKANLSIEFPDKINIVIHEIIPEFIWRNQGQYFALDHLGEIIKKVDLTELNRFSNLIILEGDNARSFVQNLLSFIKIDDKIYQYISYVEWIGDRRWNIRLTNDLLIKLPQVNPLSAWNNFLSLHKRIDFFHNKVESIDLRVKDKLFIEFDLNNPINKNLLSTVN